MSVSHFYLPLITLHYIKTKILAINHFCLHVISFFYFTVPGSS